MLTSPRVLGSLRLAVLVLATVAASPANAQPATADEVSEAMLRPFDPELLKRAEERGLYDRDAMPVLRTMNPFFIRGDFNGDGEIDLAFWVWNPGTGERGVAIVHSTLDRLHVFGAGRPRPNSAAASTELRVDTWHLLPAGHTEPHPYTSIPEIGLTAERPFTFERETLEFVHLGKSAFVLYWADGQYREFWTAD